jgi:hypothetical protein
MSRDPNDLKAHAIIFWSADLAEKEKNQSIIPKLIETQDKFISILHVADDSPTGWKSILPKTTNLPPNLFLKHLMVLTDIGGESLKRFKTELPTLFEHNTMHYIWNETQYSYQFNTLTLPNKLSWSNESLGADGDGLLKPKELTPEMEDVVMLLMHGASSINSGLPDVISDRCVIGGLLGNKTQLDTFVRQRYIWVSRITGGATANALGNLAQDYVKEKLKSLLPTWDFSQKKIPGISQNSGRTGISFDILARSPHDIYCAIEASFQVTTNSVIERRAGQAQARQKLLHKHKHKIAYVIDGAGNFERRAALATISQYSDCTVTFKDEEIKKLADFLESIER